MVSDYTLNADRLDLTLASSLAPGDALNVLMHFDLALPPADPHHIFGFNEFQINLVDWYPFIVPYSNGWLLHPPAEVGEHLVYDAADFDVTVRLVEPSIPLTLAAGAPARAQDGTWHYQLARARTFAFSASTFYRTASILVNGIPVVGYYFDSEKTQAIAAIQEVAKAVTTYSAVFGPYPYASLSMVESPFFDGMEYDGLFFLSRDYYISSDGTVLNNLIDIAVHETSHQWWFGQVGNDQAMEPWLDEALATYSEELFYEKNYPAVTAWQNFRVDAYDPSGWVDTDIYHGVDFRIYANAVYLRGARFLQALRARMGEAAFFAFLEDYAAQMQGKISTSADFFRILRQHTPVDLSDIQVEYFSHPQQ
jgi:aminopeptidase N